ncbi:FadR family transcriptional regulator [Aquibacillus koreensis]|uniref:FadR family transcriptional regulator n=1 Tax=Aquibacillus koreensis TaxID=279446 RepID=A0A9X4AK59_9BACI|nr:FadR/GntR family transcriptional regulator [Aquibacillus koreensis]MCT2535199.1 FadR family transcriptional regulator [Aquibacillus koreensis]MDC3421058.1 FadR family transcriptional regulator [Aquibacillus koreensis]
MIQKRLSDRVADEIMSMIAIEKRFLPGDKLPNENDLSEELQISRTTLREAIRILVTNGVLEIRRGKGTFVKEDIDLSIMESFDTLSDVKVNAKDLYEMRLIFEPEAAYYATLRASDSELERILYYGLQIEEKIRQNVDRTEVEQKFHQSIVKATHNEFIEKLMPVIYQAIDKGVILSEEKELAIKDTINDHKMIMEFMKNRNPEGARSAMKIHILHAMKELGIE